MSMEISMQSVALKSSETIRLFDDPIESYRLRGRRIGIDKHGELVLFKGKQFLLHPMQCKRATDLMKDYYAPCQVSLLDTLKGSMLRTDGGKALSFIRALRTLAPSIVYQDTSAADNGTGSAQSTPTSSSAQLSTELTLHLLTTAMEDRETLQASIFSKPSNSHFGDANQATVTSIQSFYENASHMGEERYASVLTDENGMPKGPLLYGIADDITDLDSPPPLPPKMNRFALRASVTRANEEAAAEAKAARDRSNAAGKRTVEDSPVSVDASQESGQARLARMRNELMIQTLR